MVNKQKSKPRSEKMPGSRYDIFLMTAAKGEANAGDVQAKVGIDRDIQFNQDVQILSVNKLIERGAGNVLRFPSQSENAQLLFDVLSFALTYNINYNNYISSPMLMFLEQTYNQNFFTFSSVQQSDDLKTANISILKHNGFLLIYQESPFRAKIIKNSFLDLILQLNNRVVEKENKKLKPVQVEALLMEEMMKRQMSSKFGGKPLKEITDIKYITEDVPERGIFLGLSPVQLEIKKILEEKNPESLNTSFKESFEKARSLMKSKVAAGVPISVDLIIEYHKVLMDDPEIGGVLRTVPVKVAGNPNFKICDHRKIRQTLDKLIEKYNKERTRFKGLPDTIKFGAFLHNELQHTHPFVDGNSRLTRLVLEHFCSQHRLPNYEVPTAYISRYTQLTKGSKKRDDNKLFELFKEIFLFQLRNPSKA